PQWANINEALELAPFGLYIFNITFTAFVIVIFQFVLSCMIAYALTQMEFKGRALVFNLILVTYMLPPEATYVPSYTIIAKMGQLDTLIGVIITNIGSVFTIFLLRQTFMQVPKDTIQCTRGNVSNDITILCS